MELCKDEADAPQVSRGYYMGNNEIILNKEELNEGNTHEGLEILPVPEKAKDFNLFVPFFYKLWTLRTIREFSGFHGDAFMQAPVLRSVINSI